MTAAALRPPRRRLLLFRAVMPGVVDFLLQHVSDQERCLSLDFDVHVVSEECDYGEMCDRYEPDVALFEFGVDSALFRITNTDAHPEVPKIGFLHCDAYDNARAAFVAQMEERGVEAFFTHSVAMGEYFPEVSSRLFYWPNFIDPEVFHPYDVDKTIPVLITGSRIPLYPWRNRVIPEITSAVPAFVSPHPGWRVGNRPEVVRYVGEDYARLLGRSSIVPTCGSMTKDVVRKHFEIPAVGSCLVTEDTASIRAAGFSDMRNCVFAQADDVLDKVEYLLTHEDELAAIAAAGHDLVHAEHTVFQRGQVAQWLEARLARRPGQSIVQDGPFGAIRLSDAPVADGSAAVISNGVDRSLVVSGWASLSNGDAPAAARAFGRAIGYFDVPEAEVGLTWATLHAGQAEEAKARIGTLLDRYFARFGDVEPDPVQWATHIRALICAGDLGGATRAAARYPSLAHRELRRLRAALTRLAGSAALPAGTQAPADRASVVRLPERSDAEWTDDLVAMLEACARQEWAEALAGSKDRRTAVARVPAASRPRALRRWASARLGGLLRSAQRRLPASVETRLRKATYIDTRHNALLDAVERRPGRALYVVDARRLDRWAAVVARHARRNPYLDAVHRVRRADLGSHDLTDAFVYLSPAAVEEGVDPSSLLACQIVIVNGTNSRPGLALLGELRGDGRLQLTAGVPEEGDGVAILRAVRPADLTVLPEFADLGTTIATGPSRADSECPEALDA